MIKHTLFLIVISVFVFLSSLDANAQSQQDSNAAGSSRPNIIFLLSDDQAVETMGCYGNEEVRTPNLDRLGEVGVLFDNYYNTTAICMPSRATIMTGLYEYRHGCGFNHGPLKAELWNSSYPALLKEAGYLLAFAGKLGFEVDGADPADIFEFWGNNGVIGTYKTADNPLMAKYAEDYPHTTLAYAAFAEDVLKAAKKSGKPFCLSLSFKAPHTPWTPDPRFDEIYSGADFTPSPNFGRDYADYLSEQSKQGRQWPRWTNWGYKNNYDGVMAQYHELIYGIDVAVGRIREKLETLGLAENTIIIYTSDNGYLSGAHGYGGKTLPFEESARAPLIIFDPRMPGDQRGVRTDALTGNIDIAPTLLDFAGVPAPEDIDGQSLLPILENPDSRLRDYMAFMNVWPRNLPTTCFSVLTRDWKYTYWWYAGEGMQPAEDLFHTRDDPYELAQLAGDPEHEEKLEEMRGFYDQALEQYQRQAVAWHGYQRFGALFQRELSWQEKRGHLQP